MRSTWIVLKRLTRTRSSRHGSSGRRGRGRSAGCSSAKRAWRVWLRLRTSSCRKLQVGGAVGKVAAAAHAQRLVDGLLEAEVGLLDVAVLVGDAGVVGGGLHAVVGHQRQVALGELRAAARADHVDGGAEVVGAVELGHAAELPEAGLQAFGERLEALREAELDRLDIGVGQHQVVDQVRERHAGQRDAEVGHVGEVGLRHAAGRWTCSKMTSWSGPWSARQAAMWRWSVRSWPGW